MESKVRVTEIEVGDTVKGTLEKGHFVVAEIVIEPTYGMRNQSVTYTFKDATGAEFFIGRKNAKAVKIT